MKYKISAGVIVFVTVNEKKDNYEYLGLYKKDTEEVYVPTLKKIYSGSEVSVVSKGIGVNEVKGLSSFDDVERNCCYVGGLHPFYDLEVSGHDLKVIERRHNKETKELLKR